MANKVPMEFSPFVGPDSLRAVTHLMKALFENQTPRSYGHEDVEGSYYEGTVENWGAELLTESRKLLLDKPSLKSILIENTFDYYFDVKYSGFVNTYDQQNLLCALLKKDVLLSNRTYKLKFENVVPRSIPRSKSSSDPVVEIDQFMMTLTPPTLVEIENDTVIAEHTLKLSDKSGLETVYFFHIDIETEDFYNEPIDGTIVTEPITDSMHGYPMIWMCVNELKTLPDLRFEGNEYGEDEKPFLTLGTNGHDEMLVYPFLSLTSEEIDVSKFLIKILPTDNSSFYTDTGSLDQNYVTDISEIQFCYYSEEINVHERPDLIYSITFDDTFCAMNIIKNDNLSWRFRLPVEGDYDYDGTTYINRVYAYINASEFESDISKEVLIPITRIKFDSDYMYEKEFLSLNAYAGVHVDVTSEHSDNDVIKKNGVIHSFGDFDGLPTYFKYDPERNRLTHRAHVEMYALRDQKNNNGQDAMDKPSAGVIIDSGIPQTELPEVSKDLPVTIRFDNTDPINRHFKWYDPPISKYNVLSEITYIDPYHFGNARINSQRLKQKFVYHGNRHFSLHGIGFDPELEYGRVYIISNDKATYENNETADNPKAPTTFARICDIPTHYSQLISIPNLSPTFILDTDYIRTELNYGVEDIYPIHNRDFEDHIININGNVLFNKYSINVIPGYANTHYKRWDNLISWINLNNDTSISFDIDASESINYENGDEFDFHIGGINIKGKVSGTDQGKVTSVLFYNANTEEYDSPRPVLKYDVVNIVNLTGTTTIFDVSPKSGSGTGLKVILNIDPDYYETLQPITNGIITDLIFFYKDDHGNVSIYNRTENESLFVEQVTGAIEYPNAYDSLYNLGVDTTESLLYTYIENDLRSLDGLTGLKIRAFESGNIPGSEDVYSGEDRSDQLNADFRCYQDSFYVLDNSDTSIDNAIIVRFTTNDISNDTSRFILPEYSDLDLSVYNPKTNIFKMNDDIQPSLFIYDPTIDTKYTLENTIKDFDVLKSSSPMTYRNVFVSTDFLPMDVVNEDGFLNMNVYSYNEYDTSTHDEWRNVLNNKTRDELVEMVRGLNPSSEPLKYETGESLYAYSKEMLIDYIVENTLYWEGDDVSYTNAPPSIYRKPEISLYATRGTRVVDNQGLPIADRKQPTGDFVKVTSDVFNPHGKLGDNVIEFNPSFIFKLDGVDPRTLDGFRMKDEYGNDVSTESIIIINTDMYVASIIGENITWVKIYKTQRSGD